ncbi:D-alanyl-D-alanine carboxypeptidase [Clostridium tertium]|uniref:D-alanyl-D-alanine carboxypeptidase n=1 Tax=Clostridium tertium TaxID=1559 RepID=A0A6N3C0M5_9CLOT
MNKKQISKKQALKNRTKKLVLFLVILGIVIYGPIKFKHIKLNKNEAIASERFNSELETIQDFKIIKKSIDNIYGDDSRINKIKESIDSIQSKLNDDINEELKNEISSLYTEINQISAENERDLEAYSNKINSDDLKGFNEEEINKVNDITNSYNALFKEKKYIDAKEKLQELETYIESIKKEANARRVNEKYNEASNEDPSTREPKYVNGVLIVNKEYGLPDTFAPGESEEARQAFENMKADASKEGIYLNAFSTYRNFWTQNRLYNNYVANYGQDPTDTFSARAGFSEHQTGLAFDIGGADRSLWAEENFKYTDEAKWLKENCHKYGFILRYPEGKEWKTGYMHESWHFRYVGVEHSKNFKNSDLTLEEYLGL